MPPKTTTWTLEPHTRGKHLVLENYMQAWLPIMTRWNGSVLFIDAFAGPGEYADGEPGSPVIVMRALLDHSAMRRRIKDVLFIFIEKRTDRSKHLESMLRNDEMLAGCNWRVFNSAFDKTLPDVLNSVARQRADTAPAFVMIDPFRISGTPMDIVATILDNPKSEVYISFMYSAISRFGDHENFEHNLDELFGCPDWRNGLNLSDGKEKTAFFFQLYEDQLKKNGARYVVRFELYDGRRLVYAIFFGTTNPEGCDKMKKAVWKVAPMGDYKFQGSRQGQLMLGDDEFVDYGQLEEALQRRFANTGWVRIEDVTNFVKSDATDFHSGQLKTKTLKPMEADGKLKVQVLGSKRRRPGTYPDGRTKLCFL